MTKFKGAASHWLALAGLMVGLPGTGWALERSQCRFDLVCPTGAACRAEAFQIDLTRSSPIDAVVGVTVAGRDLAGEFVQAETGGIAIVIESPSGGLVLRVGDKGSAARLTDVPFGPGDVVTRTGSCGPFR